MGTHKKFESAQPTHGFYFFDFRPMGWAGLGWAWPSPFGPLMQKSWQKFQTLLDRLDDFQTNEISFCWKEQCLNYKFCTRHIFPERT
jgi:hypothetical protein